MPKVVLRFIKVSRKFWGVAIFLATWQLLVSFNVMYPLMFGNLPSPVQVVTALLKLLQDQGFYYHIFSSFIRIALGSVAALVIAVPLGLFIGLSGWGREVLFPVFEMLRPIPQISWIPVAILLFPTVEGSILYITFLGAFFPILINTIAGVKSIPQVLLDAAKSMGARHRQIVTRVVFPAVLPFIFTGFTVGTGVSWMSVIAAEMISGKFGIGYFTWTSYTLMAYADTIVGMVVIGAMGSLCFSMIRGAERKLVKWRY
ncbi:ABC transporter permease [Zhaonella formicivorans]|jgi:NitT/TauT family transport system permease protein|uniref:ABC transporter permease n=1 Tax=Zhaonella formicivorans TaxID=2528593 RepID=UPI0010CE7097|nr:ABC transporter permease [Zhaonella formicivorans]